MATRYLMGYVLHLVIETAIYLPSRDTAAVDMLHFDDELDARMLESMLAERAGQPVRLDDELVRVERVESRDEAVALVRMSGVYDSERLASR